MEKPTQSKMVFSARLLMDLIDVLSDEEFTLDTLKAHIDKEFKGDVFLWRQGTCCAAMTAMDLIFPKIDRSRALEILKISKKHADTKKERMS